jgi:protein gp37
MSTKSRIEWTEVTWNPVTGCSKISSGCQNCYAERMAHRLKAMGSPRYKNGFKVALHQDIVTRPMNWKKPKMIFVNSMSDLFHEDVPFEFIDSIFDTMANTPQHIYQILTKRSPRLLDLSHKLNWTDNIWIGVSVENQNSLYRICDLSQVPAKVRFISCEPLLENLPSMPLDGIHWVIVGGESGPNSRPIEDWWVKDILHQCKEASIPFFFKQWGGTNKKENGRKLNNKTYNELPHSAKSHPAVSSIAHQF